ncbi:uncharacterized protein LOC130747488 [Lotus japonicus]|uniref:uncharacterized protein LOC130747488 n=1 Tax=Lotus japonicus TaxID=34305 RepID=UPI0025909DB7|nr:uncharacterized protein LOC130747488 [Lotus japonicus]
MMPDDVAACHDGERVDAPAMHGSKSAWMSHWANTSCKSATPARSHLTLRVGCKLKEVKEHSDAEKHGEILGSEVAVDSSMHAGDVGEASGATRVSLNNGANTGKSKKTNFDSKSYPIFNFPRKIDRGLSTQGEQNGVRHADDGKCEAEACSEDANVSLNGARSHLPSTSAHASPNTETLVRECQVLSQEVLPPALPLLKKSPYAVEPKDLAASTLLWDGFVKSASELVPNRRDKGKMLMPQFTRGPYEVYQSSYNLASEEHFTSTKYHSYSSLFIHEKKISSLVEPHRSSFTRLMHDGIAHFPHDPIAGSDDGLYFVRGQRRKTQNYTANPNIADQTAFFESTKPQKFCDVTTSLVPQVPCAVHDVETMKIYTGIDSVEESSRGHPKLSQTTHHLLMSKKTDVNLPDRGQFFRDSAAPTKFRGNTFNRIIDLSSPMSNHAREGLKLETQGSSRKTEGKENVQDFKCPTNLKNESSAETDTMDISALHETLPGDVPLQINKCFKDSQNLLTSQVAETSARVKTIAKSANTAMLDMNKEPHELLTHASPVVDRETSTSRTHSLDVEQLLSHADENAKTKSGSSSLGPDPSSRWVKRLKLCTLGSAHGTKSEQIGETSSNEKVKNTFSKTSLETKVVCPAEGQTVPDLPATALTNGNPSFTEAKKTVDITLSHPWIQRWSHSRAACSQKSHELVEFREPKSSNTTIEEFQKKQFPSIAAMALMGKAMNGLNPSELTKKGPIIVWNTKGF